MEVIACKETETSFKILRLGGIVRFVAKVWLSIDEFWAYVSSL